MFPQPLRHTALPLLLVAVFATSAPANWFSDWFHAVGHEELPTPQPEVLGEAPAEMPGRMSGRYVPTPDPVSTGDPLSAAERLPVLVPPYQSHRWAEEEEWMDDGERSFSDAVPGGLLPADEWNESDASANVWSDVWAEDDSDQGLTLFDPPYPTDLDAAPTCCASPAIRYWNHPLIGLATGRGESAEKQYTVLELANDCCPIQVPVSIPVSCLGAPELETQHGLLGRTTHTFCWPCGYRLKIVRWGEGDLMVHTYNPPDALPLQCMRSSSGGRLIEL